jgi:hypothetical protein
VGNLVYPVLPGLVFGNTRSPAYNTGIQAALSGKESRIAYQMYPLLTFTLQYELLRDYITVSDLKALTGLFMACQGKWDTFLFTDPAFNTVVSMPFASPDGVSTSFQTTATYQDAGPGGPELIQNFNGVPKYFINRYGLLDELLSATARTQLLLQSQTLSNAAWAKSNQTVATSATAAPDGTLTATDLIDSVNTLVFHNIGQTATIGAGVATYTASMFIYTVGVLEGSFVWLSLVENIGSTQVSASVNLASGVISNLVTGANFSGLSATMVSLGNGWLRLTITATKTNAATGLAFQIFPAQSAFAANYAGVVSAKMATVWGFQLEQGTQATMYLPSTTAQITQDDYTIGPTGIFNTSPVVFPAVGVFQWSGSFFYRCRFDDDSLDVSQFLNKFWEAKKVTLRQVKL